MPNIDKSDKSSAKPEDKSDATSAPDKLTDKRSNKQPRRWLIAVWWAVSLGILGTSTLPYLRSLWVAQNSQVSFEGDNQAVPADIFNDPAFSDLYKDSPPELYGRYRKPTEPTKILKQSQKIHKKPVKIISSAIIASNVDFLNNRFAKKKIIKTSPRTQQVVVATAPVSNKSLNQSSTTSTTKSLNGQPTITNLPKVNILLIGNDKSELGKGRGDVLLVMNLDPNKQRITFLSIPRDSRTFFRGRGIYKINAGYQFGGANLQALAIERFLGIPMDYIMEISRTGFKNSIDAVGGVTVKPTFAFKVGNLYFATKSQHLTGQQALAYVTMRYQDPKGDLGRNDRQQEVVKALLKSLPQRSISELNELVLHTEGHVRSNLRTDKIYTLALKYKKALLKQRTLKVRGFNKMIGGAAFYVVSNKERRRLHLLLR